MAPRRKEGSARKAARQVVPPDTADDVAPDSQSAQPATLADAAVPVEVLERLGRVQRKLLHTRRAILGGRAVSTETIDRLDKFARREELLRQRESIAVAARSARELAELEERIIGRDDILRIGFLARGMLAARSVCRLVVMGGFEHGTGFLVAPDALITNNHVLPDPDRAYATEAEWELYDLAGTLTEIRRCELAPDRFWFTDVERDFTVVALADTPDASACAEGLGWHPMIGQQGKIRIGDPVNIIQHPGGRPKSVVLHNSNLLHLENDTDLSSFLWYSSDTEPGSSGAPVFNNHWEIIGVHHRSVPNTNNAGELLDEHGRVISQEDFRRDPSRAVWIANQGVRTSQVVMALEAAGFDRDRHTAFRDALLARWEESRLRNVGQSAALAATMRSAADPAHETKRSGIADHEPAGVARCGRFTIRISIEPGA
jgi:endonuclease G, mitochondrial